MDLDGQGIQVEGVVCGKEQTSTSACLILKEVKIWRKGSFYRGRKVRVSYYLGNSGYRRQGASGTSQGSGPESFSVAGKSSRAKGTSATKQVSGNEGASTSDVMPEAFQKYKIGNTLYIKGTCSYFQKARNPGNFDARSYYAGKGMDFSVYPKVTEVLSEKENFWLEGMSRLKYAMRKTYLESLSDRQAGVLCRMALGDSSVMEDETKELYQDAGISHLLAVSGLHISIVGMMLYRFLRKRGIPYAACGILCSFLVVQYAALSGFSVSSRRAACMFMAMSLANGAGQAYDSLSALSLAGMMLLFIQPLQMFSPSFQLSFLAAAGTALIPGILEECMEGKAFSLRSSFLLCCSVQLFTLPVVLYYFYRFPVYGILANLVLVPFAGVILVSGLLGGLAGCLYLPAARLLLFPAKWLLFFFSAFCRKLGSFPLSSQVCGRPPVWKIVTYYLVFAIAFWYLSGKRKRAEAAENADACREIEIDDLGNEAMFGKTISAVGAGTARAGAGFGKPGPGKTGMGIKFEKLGWKRKPGNIRDGITGSVGKGDSCNAGNGIAGKIKRSIRGNAGNGIWNRTGQHVPGNGKNGTANWLRQYLPGNSGGDILDDRRRKRRRDGVRCAVLFASLVLAVLFLQQRPAPALEISMLDVGQGEGILVRTPFSGSCFIDGGSTDIRNVGKYRIKPFLESQGVGMIDWWFVSHTDEDHISGLEELIEDGFPIGHLVFAENMVRDEVSERLEKEAEENGIEVLYMEEGDRVVLGKLSLECVFPSSGEKETDKNDACLVLQLSWNRFKALFTGDASEKTEQALARRGHTEKENLLQVAHHGSDSSSSRLFLDAAKPDLALISAGIDNAYGHPSPNTVKRISEYTGRIYVTKENGCIRVFVHGNKMTVRTMTGIQAE